MCSEGEDEEGGQAAPSIFSLIPVRVDIVKALGEGFVALQISTGQGHRRMDMPIRQRISLGAKEVVVASRGAGQWGVSDVILV